MIFQNVWIMGLKIMDAEVLQKLIDFIKSYGFTGLLFIIIIIIVAFPEKAEKLKVLFLTPTFKLFKWGSKQYINSKITSHSYEFLSKHIKKYLPDLPDYRIKIKWIDSDSDSVLKENNTLILRIQETNDQTRNTLAAMRVALPKIVCPNLRHNIKDFASSAIDLTLLRKLSEKLGKYAGPIYQKYFLYPELEKHSQAAKLITKLLSIDRAGIFIAIFIEELNKYGSFLYTQAILDDRTDEIIDFLNFLVRFAEREIGEEIPLAYNTQEFNIAFILLAKSMRAETEGVAPYIKRIKKYVSLSYETIYIYAYPPARDFLTRLAHSIEGENEIIIEKRIKLELTDKNDSDRISTGELVKLRTVKLFDNSFIEDKLSTLGIKEGVKVEGTIIDVAKNTCIVDVKGINCFLLVDDCSWNKTTSCNDIFEENDKLDLLVKYIDKENNRVYLTGKLPETNPIKLSSIPKKDSIISVKVKGIYKSNLLAKYDRLEILIPFSEISWLPYDSVISDFVDKDVQVKIINISSDSILASIRQAEEDPWPVIHKSYFKGKEMLGEVISVSENSVRVRLPDGLTGFINKESMIKAGYEYENYLKNVVKGQGLEVVVSKVFINRRIIRFELKRNLAKKST